MGLTFAAILACTPTQERKTVNPSRSPSPASPTQTLNEYKNQTTDQNKISLSPIEDPKRVVPNKSIDNTKNTSEGTLNAEPPLAGAPTLDQPPQADGDARVETGVEVKVKVPTKAQDEVRVQLQNDQPAKQQQDQSTGQVPKQSSEPNKNEHQVLSLLCGDVKIEQLTQCLIDQAPDLNQTLRGPQPNPQTNSQTNSQINLPTNLLKTFSSHPLVKKAKYSEQQWRELLNIQTLYEGPTGNSDQDAVTIKMHTDKALNIFVNQKEFYREPGQLGTSALENFEKLMAFTIALHDIGKSIAVRLGDKNQEEFFSVPIARVLLKRIGFPSKAIGLATGLIEQHQLIGDTLKKVAALKTQKRESEINKTIQLAISKISQQAKISGVSNSVFVKSLAILFIADANSYDYLSKTFFHNKNGSGSMLVPNDEDTYEKLLAPLYGKR